MSSDLAAREKLRHTVRRSRLFDPGETVLVAVSGGVDSIVLLHLLAHLPPKLRPRPVAAHFNHGLRGRVSDADQRFVKKVCASWNIPFRTARAPRWKTKENLEARARDLRYAFLVRAARRSRARKVVTAHQADDQLETFVMRWLQGAGLRGLAGIRTSRPLTAGKGKGGAELVRPLLDVTRAEIEAYARAMRLPFREDATNRSGRFLRNRLRRILRALQRENPNLAERAATNAIFLQADERYLEDRTVSDFRAFARRSRGRTAFSLARYRRMPEALRFRLLQTMARHVVGESFALPAVAVLKVDEILRDWTPRQRYDLPSRLRLEKDGQRFVFARKSAKNRIDSRGTS